MGSKKKRRRKSAKRGVRRRVLGSGEGDYCIFEVAPQGSTFPAGTLVPIPTVPRFPDTFSAMKWIRNESGDLLVGKTLMVFQAKELLTIRVQTKPTVVIEAKQKVTLSDPSEESKPE